MHAPTTLRSASSQGSRSAACCYSSYGNRLLQRTCCCIHPNEKSICGQGNNKALNYCQHTSNLSKVHFSSSSRAPPPPPHINSTVFVLTSLSLNHIKDFPDYYYKCKITSARPPAAAAVINPSSRASSFRLEVPLFINSSKHGEHGASHR